jgi:ATP-dependent Lon protease
MNKLNQKVYGMDEIKEELICIVTNMIKNPQSKFKVIGLYGPPGIGKTMIANVISEGLGLPMEKISLGGMTDSSFLEGHGFTYIGSEPGCIVKALTKMGCTNGIIYLDELDKISKSDKGKEIEHSLLHITDFTQNHDFKDKYMPEIPVNLSDCIFICSMNTIEELDSALLSRIPVVKFNGYTSTQKIIILQNYLLPEVLTNYGMSVIDFIITNDVAKYLIENIREEDESNGKSGVRGLKNILNKIINRINLYKLSAINGKLPFKMSFEINNFKLPYTLTTKLIDQILKNAGIEKDLTYQLLYN